MPEFLAVSGVAGISEFDLAAGTRGDLEGSGSLGGCDIAADGSIAPGCCGSERMPRR
jgi:hypothetical protein